MSALSLAYSPCPNDTFIFHAWVSGLVDGAPVVRERLEDIDTLNGLAARGEVDVAKVSIHAFAHLRETYALLHSGGAMVRRRGPLIVARKESRLPTAPSVRRVAALADDLVHAQVAIPGELTTAALLAGLLTGGLERAIVMPFDRIMPAVASGEVDAGVIIHEGRFTFGSYGLRCLIDLGEWWDDTHGLPLPLGGIVVRRPLAEALKGRIENAVRSSVELARADQEAALEHACLHSQEMDPVVCRSHIDLYVNDFTLDYGQEGEVAIRRLLQMAPRLDAIPRLDTGVFWDE